MQLDMFNNIHNNMKKISLLFVFTLLVCVSLSSCITFLGSYRKVHINSSPSGASIYRDDGQYVGQTPLLYRGKRAHDFTISKSGYKSKTIYPPSKWDPLWYLNIPLMYGLLENPYTFKEKESYYNVTLEPIPKSAPVPTPTRVPTLLESVSTNTDNYTCANALSRIKPAFSNLANRTPLRGSEIFRKYSNAVFMIYGATNNANQIWQGSGFVVSSDGLAVSNYHNFDNAQKIAIKFYESDSFYEISKEDILAYSKSEDYIIFKVKGRYNYPYIPIANRRSEIGDKVYTIGSPKGYENTFSSGEISQYRTEQGYIQITAPIDHGSSGGVLINEYREAIGITSAGRDDSGANLNFCRDLLYILNRYR